MLIALAAVLSYFIGTFPSADLASRLAFGGARSVRAEGSGNPGALNAASVLGKRWGAIVLLADFLKGVAAARLGHALGGDGAMAVASVAVVLGHCAPVWSGFRGGKGIATTGGVLLATFPLGVPIVVAALAGVVVLTKSTRLAAYGSGIALVAASALWAVQRYDDAWGIPGSDALFAMAIALTAIVVVRFRSSIFTQD